MKKTRLLLVLGTLILARPASAQVTNCFDCTLGLYDEPQLLHAFGDIVPFVPKEIYLGVTYVSPETGLTGIEFSISGLHSGTNIIVTDVRSVTTPPSIVSLGTIPAPPDTSATSTQTGGMNVAWASCVLGSQALLKITLLALGPISNHVLRVMHRFPPSSAIYGLSGPIQFRCDVPTFTAVRVSGREYILGAVVAADSHTWSGIKQIYR